MSEVKGILPGNAWQMESLSTTETEEGAKAASPSLPRKPFLEPPRFFTSQSTSKIPEKSFDETFLMRVEALLYIAMGNCYEVEKQNMDYTNVEIEKAQKAQREERKATLEKEYEAGKWGVTILACSWIASLTAMITGITLMATGIGIAAGFLMFAAGLVQIGSQVMEMTGGWEKVRELLPGNDEDKKSAMLSWIQIGITILSIILSICGVVIGGFSLIGENMQKASALMGAIALTGRGISDIGQGVTKSDHKKREAALKRREMQLTRLKYNWEDDMARGENNIPILNSIFQAISRNVKLATELTQVMWGQ